MNETERYQVTFSLIVILIAVLFLVMAPAKKESPIEYIPTQQDKEAYALQQAAEEIMSEGDKH